jgi:hypothetical protein
LVISTTNVVDAVIGAVAMQSTSTSRLTASTRPHAAKIPGSPRDFERIPRCFDGEQTRLRRVLGEFAGECPLSGRAIALSGAVRFLRSVLELGISLGRVSPAATAEMLSPSVSAKKWMKRFDFEGKLGLERFFLNLANSDSSASCVTHERFKTAVPRVPRPRIRAAGLAGWSRR